MSLNPATLITFALIFMNFEEGNFVTTRPYFFSKKSNNSENNHFIKNHHITNFSFGNDLLLLMRCFPRWISYFVLNFNFCQCLDEKRARNVSLNHFNLGGEKSTLEKCYSILQDLTAFRLLFKSKFSSNVVLEVLSCR